MAKSYQEKVGLLIELLEKKQIGSKSDQSKQIDQDRQTTVKALETCSSTPQIKINSVKIKPKAEGLSAQIKVV